MSLFGWLSLCLLLQSSGGVSCPIDLEHRGAFSSMRPRGWDRRKSEKRYVDTLRFQLLHSDGRVMLRGEIDAVGRVGEQVLLEMYSPVPSRYVGVWAYHSEGAVHILSVKDGRLVRRTAGPEAWRALHEALLEPSLRSYVNSRPDDAPLSVVSYCLAGRAGAFALVHPIVEGQIPKSLRKVDEAVLREKIAILAILHLAP